MCAEFGSSMSTRVEHLPPCAEGLMTTDNVVIQKPQRVVKAPGRLLVRMDSEQAVSSFMCNNNRAGACMPSTAEPFPMLGGPFAGNADEDTE